MSRRNGHKPDAAKGRLEAEGQRQARALNYAVKRANGFTCAELECEQSQSVLVVQTEDGYSTRCSRHLGDLEPMTGQWNERLAEVEQ